MWLHSLTFQKHLTPSLNLRRLEEVQQAAIYTYRYCSGIGSCCYTSHIIQCHFTCLKWPPPALCLIANNTSCADIITGMESITIEQIGVRMCTPTPRAYTYMHSCAQRWLPQLVNKMFLASLMMWDAMHHLQQQKQGQSQQRWSKERG